MGWVLKLVPWEQIILFVITKLMTIRTEDIYRIIDVVMEAAKENIAGSEKFAKVLEVAKKILSYVKHEQIIAATIELIVRWLKKDGKIN